MTSVSLPSSLYAAIRYFAAEEGVDVQEMVRRMCSIEVLMKAKNSPEYMKAIRSMTGSRHFTFLQFDTSLKKIREPRLMSRSQIKEAKIKALDGLEKEFNEYWYGDKKDGIK